MVGGLMSGWLADKMGRKGALLFNNLFAVIAAVLMTMAKYVDVYYLMTVGRLIIGFNAGAFTESPLKSSTHSYIIC